MQEKKALSSRGRGRLIATGEAIPLRGLEGVPGLPGAPQDEAGLTRKFETSPGKNTGVGCHFLLQESTLEIVCLF